MEVTFQHANPHSGHESVLVRLSGDVRPFGNATIDPDGEVRLIVTVDRGPGYVFDYRLDVPVRTGESRVRALSPRVEQCFDVRTCGGSAAYVPERAPEGVSVRTNLSAT